MSESTSTPADLVRRFIFENRPVRGHLAQLNAAWRELRAHGHYPASVESLLGEAVAAAVLLAATLKFSGTLTFQLQGNGAVGLLVAQCTHDFRLRAVARYEAAAVAALAAESGAALFHGLTGANSRITVTVEADERHQRYQGIVPLGGDSLAESLEAYFASSEQLPTRVVLSADSTHAAGMLVQKLPDPARASSEDVAAAWDSAQRGIAGIAPGQLHQSSLEGLLETGFPGHDLRVFRGSAVRFECRCSPARVSGLLRALGPEEVRDVLKEQGSVTVTCEFCHRPYRFDPIDVDALFAGHPPSAGSAVVH
jgi:molecular chaperone Hsp33